MLDIYGKKVSNFWKIRIYFDSQTDCILFTYYLLQYDTAS